MPTEDPIAELDPEFSSDNAQPTSWADARTRLDRAEIYWLATVRPDGRPHVTPLLCIWLDNALHFCTGRGERKAKNLEHNTHCVITTGCNTLNKGMDLVVEGDAIRAQDEALLQRLADAYSLKYGWLYTVHDGALLGEGGEAIVYRVTPTKAFGFGKGTFSQTRWRFPD